MSDTNPTKSWTMKQQFSVPDNPIETVQNVNNDDTKTTVSLTLQKKAWTKEDDELLKRLVQQYGPNKWTIISKSLPGELMNTPKIMFFFLFCSISHPL